MYEIFKREFRSRIARIRKTSRCCVKDDAKKRLKGTPPFVGFLKKSFSTYVRWVKCQRLISKYSQGRKRLRRLAILFSVLSHHG